MLGLSSGYYYLALSHRIKKNPLQTELSSNSQVLFIPVEDFWFNFCIYC